MIVWTHSRAIALLMCSVTLTVCLCILATSTPVYASNCCQTCEEIDSACAAGCAEPEHCGENQECLAQCFASCDAYSASCWGVQGQGPFCTWCEYHSAQFWLCVYSTADEWQWAVGHCIPW